MADDVKDPLDLDDAPADVPEEAPAPEPEASDLTDEASGHEQVLDLGPDEEDAGTVLEQVDEDPPSASMDDLTNAPEVDGWLGDDEVSGTTPVEALEPDLDEDRPGEDWVDMSEDGTTVEMEWSALEDERQTLPPGRVLVGRREFVSLPQLGLHDVTAAFDTGEAESTIRAKVVSVQSGQVMLDVDGTQGLVSGALSQDGVSVQLNVVLAGVTRSIRFRVTSTVEEHRLVFGRDAMAGYLVVDVAMSFLHRRVGSASPGI